MRRAVECRSEAERNPILPFLLRDSSSSTEIKRCALIHRAHFELLAWQAILRPSVAYSLKNRGFPNPVGGREIDSAHSDRVAGQTDPVPALEVK